MPKYIEAVFNNLRNGFDMSMNQVGGLLDNDAMWEPIKMDTVPPAEFKPTDEHMDQHGFDDPKQDFVPTIQRGEPHLEEEPLPMSLVSAYNSNVEQVINSEAPSQNSSLPERPYIPPPMILEEAPIEEVVVLKEQPDPTKRISEKIRSAVSSIFTRPIKTAAAIATTLGFAATLPYFHSADASITEELKTSVSASTAEAELEQVNGESSFAVEEEIQPSFESVSENTSQDNLVDSSKPVSSVWDSVEEKLLANNRELSSNEIRKLSALETNQILRDNHDELVSKLENSGYFKSEAFFADVKDMLEDSGGYNIPSDLRSFWDVKNSPNLNVEEKNTLLEQAAACILDSAEISELSK